MKWTAAGAAAIVAVAVLAGTPAGAHHSILAIVDTSTRLQADMVLTKLDWINPHVWFHFSMTEPDGVIVFEVPIEWLGIGAMHRAGIYRPDAFTVGQTYTVTYNPNRDGSFGGEIVMLVDDQTGHVFSADGGGPAPAAGSPGIDAADQHLLVVAP
jgi:hypothetical protein